MLSNRSYADGTGGFFDPLNFGFGQSVYLSRLYAALETVEGLDSAQVTSSSATGRSPATSSPAG